MPIFYGNRTNDRKKGIIVSGVRLVKGVIKMAFRQSVVYAHAFWHAPKSDAQSTFLKRWQAYRGQLYVNCFFLTQKNDRDAPLERLLLPYPAVCANSVRALELSHTFDYRQEILNPFGTRCVFCILKPI